MIMISATIFEQFCYSVQGLFHHSVLYAKTNNTRAIPMYVKEHSCQYSPIQQADVSCVN